MAWMARPEATEAERLRLRAKFDDPASIRGSYEEFVKARRDRRDRREALHAATLAAAQGRAKLVRTADRLSQVVKEDRP